MENDDEIKQHLLSLYTELQNPSLLNANEVSDSILEIYSSSSSIPVLFDIFGNSENQNFKLQASIGLKYSLSICSSQLDQSSCNTILENFYQLILNENDDYNIDILMPPIIELFKILHCDWNFISEFVTMLSQTDLSKCFQIISSLLSFVDPQFVISQFSYFTDILSSSFESPDKLSIFKYTFLIFVVLANDVKIDNFELFDNLINCVSKPFSEILILLLDNEKLFDDSIISILDSLELRVNPFLLELLFQPIIDSLQNSEFSYNRKYCIILLFENLLSCDSSFEIDLETLQQLIISSIPLSVELFDQSDDLEYPDSHIFSDFYFQCLNRISNNDLKTVFQNLIDSFSSPENPAEIYNLMMFYDACLRRSDFLFDNEFNLFVSFLIECLQIDLLSIRNEVIYVFCFHKNLLQSMEKDQIYSLIVMVIDIISSKDFLNGLTFIKVLIDLIDDSDPVFELTFSMCTQIIKENSENDFSLTQIGWKILNGLIRNSKKNVLSVFDNLYSNSFSMINSYIENKENLNSNFVGYAIKCLSSLSINCQEQLIEKIDELFPILVNLFENSDNLKLYQSILKCFDSFASNLKDAVENYICSFLGNIFMNFFTHVSLKNLTEENVKEYSVYLFTPSINFLTKILQIYPHFFIDKEMISYLFSIFKKGINQVFEKEIIASLHLFKKIMIFMNKSDIIVPDIVVNAISNIIDKMKKEISPNVIRYMFDAINKALSIFGNSIIFQREVHLFQFVLTSVDSNKNSFTNELQYNHVYNEKALQLLSNIIRNFYDNEDSNFEEFNDLLINSFIPRIIIILNDSNPLFIAFGLNLFSQFAISTKGILSTEILNDPIQKSLENIESINGLTIPSIIFIDSLVYNYPQVLESLTPQLVEIIENQISSLDCSNVEEKCYSEYYITLLTILDTHVNDLIDEEKMGMILSYLPIVFSKTFNNKHIYSFLLRHYKDFQNNQFEILKNIVMVFESAATIIDSQLPQEIISNLLSLIIQSDISSNQNDLNALFSNQTDVIQSFLLTISFLSERIKEEPNDN